MVCTFLAPIIDSAKLNILYYIRENQLVQEHEAMVTELKGIITENDEHHEHQLSEFNYQRDQVFIFI